MSTNHFGGLKNFTAIPPVSFTESDPCPDVTWRQDQPGPSSENTGMEFSLTEPTVTSWYSVDVSVNFQGL